MLPGLGGMMPPPQGMAPGPGFPPHGMMPRAPAPGGGGGGMPPDVLDQLNHLREDHSKMVKAAQEADEGGKKFKMMLAGEIMEEIKELEDKHKDAGGPGPGPGPCPGPGPGAGAIVQARPPHMLPGLMPPPPGLMGGHRPSIIPPPGGCGPGSFQDMQRMMTLYQNPDMGANVTLQRALEYEQEKANSSSMEPEVVELTHHFNLTDRHARMLDEQLKKRNNTYEDDIAAMYEILKGAKNPADLLMVSIRWMSEGIFRGCLTPNTDVEKIAKKFRLDAPSACKLAEVLETRKDPDDDLKRICSHLERSNKPSSLVMMMLKDIKAGNPITESTKQPAIGSFLHREETKKQARQRSRSRGRGGGGRRSP